MTGAEVLLAADGWRALAGQKVGVINPTGILPDLRHIVDTMHASGKVNGRGLRPRARLPRQRAGRRFRGGPHRPAHRDHGVRPTAANASRGPLHRSGVETVVDIQDVGARFYTYIWTMYEAMIAAVRTGASSSSWTVRTRSAGTRAARCSSPVTPRVWARRRSSSSTA